MPVQCTCRQCGAAFQVSPSDVHGTGGKYCSLACFQRSRRPHVSLTCQQCGQSFVVWGARALGPAARRFCSRGCAYAHRSALSSRFWELIDRNGPVPDHRPGLGSCWIWTGKRKVSGYGRLNYHRVQWQAHRLSYTLTFGPIPSGLLVCHHCDNPPCVRPDHLFLGTHAENNTDRDWKGRQVAPSGMNNGMYTKPNRRAHGERHGSRTKPGSLPRGEAHHKSKLGEADVREIRRAYATGGWLHETLAARFGVSKSTVGHIVRHQTWRHVI